MVFIMKPKLLLTFFIFFTILLFGGGRLLAVSDTVWRQFVYGDVHQTLFSPNDSLLAVYEETGTGRNDYRISILNPETGDLLRFYEPIQYPKFTSDGQYLVGYHDSDIVVLRVDSLIPLSQYQKATGIIKFIDISSDGQKIYADYGKAYIDIWDFTTGQRISDISYDSCNGCSNMETYAMSISDSLNTLIVEYRLYYGNEPKDPKWKEVDKNIAFDLINKTKRYDITPRFGGFVSKNLIMSNNRKHLYETNDSAYFKRDISSGNIIDTFLISNSYWLSEFIISNDEKYMLITFNNRIEVWNLINKTKVYTYQRDDSGPYDMLSLSNSNKYMCALGFYLYMYATPWLTTNVKKDDGIKALITYPNPGESKINLEFNLEKPGNTKIQIMDLKGNIVKILQEKYLEEGNHNLTVNTGDLIPGIYLMRLESGTSNSIKKIIINK